MKKIVPSIMCADQLHLSEELKLLDEAKLNWLHCDVMDGIFVNNLAMGPYVLKQITSLGKFTTDIHLACVDPQKYIEMFSKINPDYLTFHIEATTKPEQLIDLIHQKNIYAGIAVSPQTRIESIFHLIEKIDLVLMMTVNPGFSGQSFQYHVLDKIKKLNTHIKYCSNQPLIEVDGNIHVKTAKEINKFGANLYVVGTSALFNQKDGTYQEKAQEILTSLE